MGNLSIFPAFEENNYAITLQSSDYFAPYAAVTIQSIIDNCDLSKNYDIIILTIDMSKENTGMLCAMSKENVSIRVFNVEEKLKKYINLDDKRYGGALAVRLILAEVLFNYPTVLNVDCDMIFKADVSGIFSNDISDYYMGAVNDLYGYISYAAPGDKKHFCEDVIINFLGLSDISQYHNCGLFLLNLEKIRCDFTSQQMFDFAADDRIRFLDQDTLNHLFVGKILTIDAGWNWFTDGDLFIRNYQKHLPKYDPVLKLYNDAAKAPKNLHYLASVKPWHNANTPYADEWWNVAVKTPFLSLILSRANEQDEAAVKKNSKAKKQYLLFICETYYDLINVLNIKYHLYPNVPADLILTSSSNLAKYIDIIENTGLFDKVLHTDYCASVDIAKMRAEWSKDELTLSPDKYEFAVSIKEDYTDYFMAVASSPYQKMVYYQIVNNGIIPSVHFYEDGAENYTVKIADAVKRDGIRHELYPEKKRFLNNVKNVYIYKPQLYCGGEKLKFIPIPTISEDDKAFAAILHSIFGKCTMPKEKYIFFNECFATDMRVSNDIEILNSFAEIVGKENIAVKVHPRSINADVFYKLHGYSIFSDTTTPWELFALSGELENRVMITVSSIAPITPFLMLGKGNYSIYLHNVMKLSQRNHATTQAYHSLIDKLRNAMNSEKKCFFCPKTIKELQLIIDYLEGEI